MMPTYLTLQQAADIRGGSINSLRLWVVRWNKAHPEKAIRRMHGRVCRQDLDRALGEETRQATPQLALVERASRQILGLPPLPQANSEQKPAHRPKRGGPTQPRDTAPREGRAD